MKDQKKEPGERVEEGGNCRLTWGPYVEAGAGHYMPAWLEFEQFRFDEPDLRARIELRDNVPRIVEITLRSEASAREVMTKDLRELNLQSLVDDLYAPAVMRTSDRDGSSKIGFYTDTRTVEDLLDQRRTGKRRITAEFLRQVANVYRDNIDHAPTEAVARTFGVKHRQATDYVKQARDRNLLPPTKQGRARA